MRNVKSILSATLALTLICAIVVAALAFTYDLTKETIAKQQAIATNEACKTVLPEALSYVAQDESTLPEGVLELYYAKHGDHVIGYVVKTQTSGKASGLVVMTGVLTDGTVSGVEIIEDGETAGYIDTVKKGGLLDRLLGVDSTADVQGVSQATKTSNGIKKGVQLALDTVQEVMGNE